MNYYKHFFRTYHKPSILSDYESGKILEVNDQILSISDKTNEDFFNLKRSDIYPKKAIIELDKNLKANKNNASTETFILNKEGNKVEVEINSELIIEDDKKYLLDTICVKENKQVYPSSTDLEIEKLIRESEIKYKTLFESANDAIFLLKDHSIIEFNSKALKMFACSGEELIDKKPYQLSPEFQPDGGSSVDLVIEKNTRELEGKPQFFEWQHKRF